MARPIKELVQCNPYPLLYVTKKLLTFRLSKVEKEIVTINYAVALRNTGKYEEAYQTLKSYVIESKATTIRNKIAYYNNLADICALLGRTHEFYFALETASNIANTSKSEKIKIYFNKLSLSLYMQKAMLEKQYDEVIRLSDIYFSSKDRTPTCDADTALLRAFALIGKGEKEIAKPYLESIIQHGGKLYNVTVAKNYLDLLK
jgi:predicted O-linked N-acetylglucosamine transferase (SPINDLY family)